MKKLIAVILILAMVPVIAIGDLPDISGLSYDELVQLKNQINLAMWNSQEWQEVTVPQGVWTVGEDIPVGHWSISLSPESTVHWAGITYCDQLDASGLDAGNQFYCDIYAHLTVGGPENENYPKKVDINCKPGTFIIINHGDVVFTPFTGKPDLGFK